MKRALYAGSFDPWSFGHQFVLNSALGVFHQVHVVAAVNPAKSGDLDPRCRARAIAHSINPFENWWHREPPFNIGKNVVVTATPGLVVNYAREQGIEHLIRGLRSTSDFEAEFNLYFANRAIEPTIQTWCILCPPELLHCSSTFVRAVVGKPEVDCVGTTFVTQAILLKKSRLMGHILDLIHSLSEHRFSNEPADLTHRDLTAALQRSFVLLIDEENGLDRQADRYLSTFLDRYLPHSGSHLRKDILEKKYSRLDVARLWAVLVRAVAGPVHGDRLDIICANWLARLSSTLGKTEIPLIDVILVKRVLEEIRNEDYPS